MGTEVKGQLGIDETQHEDPELEKLLERRAEVARDRSAVNAKWREADGAAKAKLEGLPIPEDGALRVGRFRISKAETKARHVEFDAAAGSRFQIDSDGDDE